ncbi:MAG: class I SAM-dependent methyltransferase [Candidatus Rokuibacteriota bacterium]|nr:MAG: class I SAM-dependent methyltransferase [Candidatus Rokubacteria bacterium]
MAASSRRGRPSWGRRCDDTDMSGDAARALRYWDRAAGAYAARRRDACLSTASIYAPVVEALLGDVRDKRVLDAGCGDGRDARKLATAGAWVTAVDGSTRMIALARRETSEARIEYCVADLTNPLPLRSRSFDVVLANMVLMDIPRVDVAIAEFARILAAGGVLVFSLPHPCFFCADWVHDRQGARLHKAVADYLTAKVAQLAFWGPTLHFHRPLSSYLDEMSGNGFVLDAVKEPMPTEDAVIQHPDLAHHRRIPSFIVGRARLLRFPTP